MAYVPIKDRDARWYIWNALFLCRIPNIQSMSIEYIQHFGMPSSGDSYADQQTANELVDRMLTINQMIEYFNKGVNVVVVKAADTKVIYEYIAEHLATWKRHLEVALNTRDAPLDDLIQMDKFANAVYKHAQYHFTQQMVDSLLARRMGSIMRVNRETIVAPPPSLQAKRIRQIKENEEQEEDQRPGRVSMAEVFAARQVAARPKWK